MRTAAAYVAFLAASILLGGAFMDFQAEGNSQAERIRGEFSEIGDDAALYRDLDEDKARSNSQGLRAVVGAGFLFAGLAVLGTRPKQSTRQMEARAAAPEDTQGAMPETAATPEATHGRTPPPNKPERYSRRFPNKD